MENEEILSNGENLTAEQEAVFGEATEEATENLGVLTKEEFTAHFIEIFNFAGEFWNIPDLKVDRNKQFDFLGATTTASKLYNMAQRYPLLHFLVEPSGGWFGDAWLIGWFVYAKSNAVSRKIDGLTITGRLKKLLKKGGEVSQKVNIFSKFFKKKEVVNG